MSDNAFAGWGGNRPTNGDNEITFTNVRILDATGDAPYAGEVTVEGNRIKRVARQGGGYSWGMTGGHRIDGRGATLMPGLVDAHLHLSWNNAPGIAPIQLMPVEEHILSTIEMAKVVLRSEEHTSELQSLMRISYAVFCLKKKTKA